MPFAETFCDSPLWDLQVTWYTDWPKFTPCFQQTILVWVPCLYLWVFTPLYLYATRKRKGPPLPISVLTVIKLVFNLTLVIVTICELILTWKKNEEYHTFPRATYCSASTKLLTFILASVLQLRDKNIGKRSSGFLLIFWLFLAVCGVVACVSEFQQIFMQDRLVVYEFVLVIRMIYYPLVVGQVLISAFAEKKQLGHQDEQQCPLTDSPFLSLLTFAWVDGIVLRAFRKVLELDELFELGPEYKSENTCVQIDKALENQLHKTSLVHEESLQVYCKDDRASTSVFWAILKGFWPKILLSSFLELCYSVITFIPVIFLNLLIGFASNDEETWKGYLYAAVIFLSTLLDAFLLCHLAFYIQSVAIQAKSALTGIVYQKALRLSSSTRRKYTLGELVNLMAVDTEQIYTFSASANTILGTPARIFIAIVLLWQYIGPSCLVGLAVMVGMMPVTALIIRGMQGAQVKQMELKDSRIKIISEILNGIKVLKFYAWEPAFRKRVNNIRKEEVISLRRFYYLDACVGFLWATSTFLVSLFSFLAYVLLDEKNVLTPNIAFVSLTLFNMLKMSLIILPETISSVVQTRVSLQRLNTYFMAEDLDLNNVATNPPKDEAIAIVDGTFTWVKDNPPILKNLNLHVKTGQLVAVVGRVGSGKSSLLSALLGEMHRIKGTVNLKGSKAYVPQQAWIQNTTLQQNILFTSSLKPHRYQRVVDACCLLPDIEMLPAGDETEIGEKGVNLSGGQKQRVSLARAVYQNADIYLLDDPLSAVDSHVGKRLFEHVIGPEGLLRDKTRILSTHNISVLSEVDVIVVMQNGEVRETGTYKELMAKEGRFAEFIKEHLQKEAVATSETTTEPARGVDGRPRLISQLSVGLDKDATNVIDQQVVVVERSNSMPPDQSSDVLNAGQLIEEEKMEIGKVKFDIYTKYLRSVTFLLSGGLLFGIAFYQASEIATNFWLSKWSTDEPLPDGTQNVPLRNFRLTIYGVLGGLQGFGMLITSVMFTLGAMQSARTLHQNMLECIIHCPMQFFDTTPMGRILNRFGKDMDDVDSHLPFIFDAWCDYSMAVLGTFIVISITNPYFLLAVVPIALLFYIIQKLFIASTRQLERLSSVTRTPVYSNFSETVSGVSSIRAYDAVDFFLDRSNDRVDTNVNCIFHIMICTRWLSARLGILSGFITLSTALLAVAGRGVLGAGIVGLSLSYAVSVTEAFTSIVRCTGLMESRIVCVERIDEFSTMEPEAPWEIKSKKPQDSWPDEGAVTFQGYSTRYRTGLDLVLQDITLKVSPMEKVGIVGRTGAGKSSLALSLFRIIEAVRGAIFIDGVNVATIGLHDLRKKLSIIPQDPVLFTGTLRSNLDPSNAYTDHDIWEALDQVHLKSFVISLTDGLNYDIAEGGENMSVGQRQLVCLARALLRKSKVLVLDEATAAVDLETDKMIQETIRTKFAKSTIITIAHRLHTILDYDRVVVMDKGQIVETGIPSSLMAQSGSYFCGLAKDAGLV